MSESHGSQGLTDWGGFIERLYAQSEFAIELGLESVSRALELEEHPESSFPIILVGGTNGKGETAAFIASILQAHGASVGLYTSPHILDLRERFRVDGRLMARTEIYEVGRYVLERYGEPSSERPQLTFFELTTLMGVLAFADREVDVGVFEVGLGGRLDATNALPAELSVVTSVGLDHVEYLGDTFESVAREKAGIFRPDRPAVIGRQAYPAAERTLTSLAPADAATYGRDYRAADQGGVELSAAGIELPWRAPRAARTRRWNAACAAEAARRFLGDDFDLAAAVGGLQANRWPGRLDERVFEVADPSGERHKQAYLFDAAHNPDGADVLFDFIEERGLRVGAVVCSAMRNKDLRGIFGRISDHVPVFAAALESARGASSEQLTQALDGKALRASGPTAQMLEHAGALVGAAEDASLIVVFGSIYLLGECFEALGVEADSLVTYRE